MALEKKLKSYKQFVESMKTQDWADYTEQLTLNHH